MRRFLGFLVFGRRIPALRREFAHFIRYSAAMKKSEALKILKLSEGATDDEIKKAHRKLVIANHPDKFGQDEAKRAAAEEKTKLINEARDVLLSRKWDPEYSTAGTRYGAPYSYNPYAGKPSGTYGTGGAGGTGQNSQNPFAGTPFESWFVPGATFVWTSWDNVDGAGNNQGAGNPYRQNPYGQSPFSASPFGGAADFNPFARQAPTAQERLAEAKSELKLDLIMLFVKVAVIIGSALAGSVASGLFLYVVLSVGQGIYKRLRALSVGFVLPLVLLVMIFAPSLALFAPMGGFLFLMAVCFDVSNIYRHAKTISECRAKIGKK